MDIKIVPISQLIFADYNPREISASQFEKLRLSIRTFGFVEPIVANEHPERQNIIVGGHMRLRAAIAEGMTEVPVVFVNLPFVKEANLNIALNRISGTWDKDKLNELVYKLSNEYDDVSLCGLEDEEISVCLDAVSGETDEDEVPAPPQEAVSKRGEVYQLGPHRLMCGDATSAEDVALLMAGAKADLVLTDPPYNVNYTGKTKDALEIQNDHQEDGPFLQFLTDAFTNMRASMKSASSIYVCHADLEGLNFRTAFKLAGFLLKQCIIWNKNHFVMGRSDYQWKHEPILYGWPADGKHEFHGDRTETTVWDISRPSRSEDHPTMKPIELCNKAIKNSSLRGQVVLDLFGGSGSTLIACEKMGRVAYVMELDPIYCDVIRRRYETLLSPTPKEAKRGEIAGPAE